MKNNKIIFLITFIFIATGFIIFYANFHPSNNPIESVETQMVVKGPTKEIKIQKASSEQLEKVKIINQNKRKWRAPATPTREGRVLSGSTGAESFRDDLASGDVKSLSYRNKPSSDWKKMLADNLMRYQTPKTEVYFTPVESHLMVVGKGEKFEGVYLEEVQVHYIQENGMHSAFVALVDSESGELIKTWGRTIHENPRGKIDISRND